MAPRRKRAKARRPEKCLLCLQGADSENLMIGRLYASKDGRILAHRNCLYFGGHFLQQRDNEWQGDGVNELFYFKSQSIRREARRCKTAVCRFCHLRNADVKCNAKGCKKTFHFPCGVRNRVLFNFLTYSSYCSDHHPQQACPPEKNLSTDSVCVICLVDDDRVSCQAGYDQFCCPKCGHWFHRRCLQKWAFTAGKRHLSCSNCKDRDAFTDELLFFGYEVLDSDAKWELDYREDFRQQEEGTLMQCSAALCLCPEGRTFSSEGGSINELVGCMTCGGANSIHRGCVDDFFPREPWECAVCEMSAMRALAIAEIQDDYRRLVERRAAKQPVESLTAAQVTSQGGSVSTVANIGVSAATSEPPLIVLSSDDEAERTDDDDDVDSSSTWPSLFSSTYDDELSCSSFSSPVTSLASDGVASPKTSLKPDESNARGDNRTNIQPGNLKTAIIPVTVADDSNLNLDPPTLPQEKSELLESSGNYGLPSSGKNGAPSLCSVLLAEMGGNEIVIIDD